MRNKRKGTEKAGFSIVSVLHHPFFLYIVAHWWTESIFLPMQ